MATGSCYRFFKVSWESFLYSDYSVFKVELISLPAPFFSLSFFSFSSSVIDGIRTSNSCSPKASLPYPANLGFPTLWSKNMYFVVAVFVFLDTWQATLLKNPYPFVTQL